MALSKGERMALYLLLFSESRFAGKINGNLTASGDLPGGGNTPLGPAGSPAAALARFQAGAGPNGLGMDPAGLNDPALPLMGMFTPNGIVSSDFHVVRTALALDSYGESGPCPSGADELALVKGLRQTIDDDLGA
jgi:hypothetical protein